VNYYNLAKFVTLEEERKAADCPFDAAKIATKEKTIFLFPFWHLQVKAKSSKVLSAEELVRNSGILEIIGVSHSRDVHIRRDQSTKLERVRLDTVLSCNPPPKPTQSLADFQSTAPLIRSLIAKKTTSPMKMDSNKTTLDEISDRKHEMERKEKEKEKELEKELLLNSAKKRKERGKSAKGKGSKGKNSKSSKKRSRDTETFEKTGAIGGDDDPLDSERVPKRPRKNSTALGTVHTPIPLPSVFSVNGTATTGALLLFSPDLVGNGLPSFTLTVAGNNSSIRCDTGQEKEVSSRRRR
jgi:hypothetical protein